MRKQAHKKRTHQRFTLDLDEEDRLKLTAISVRIGAVTQAEASRRMIRFCYNVLCAIEGEAVTFRSRDKMETERF